MEQAFCEIEDEVKSADKKFGTDPDLDVKDKEDKNMSDKEKCLKSVLKRIGESAALRAKRAYKPDKEFWRENQ